MGNKILLIGGGGNCRSLLDVLLENDFYDEIGIIDKNPVQVELFSNKIFYLGTDKELPFLFKNGWTNAFISVGSVGDTTIRRHLYNTVKKIGFFVPNIISKHAVISNNCKLSEGIFVSKGAIINIGSSIGNCCIINSNSIIEHDCQIDDFVHISPGAILCGGVHIGRDTHFGAGSVAKQNINIGNNVIIGMGSIVTKNIESNSICYGNPCHFVRRR